MAGKPASEPNPATGRRLTSRFFDDLIGYLEAQASFGRPYGLLSVGSTPEKPLAYLDPPDVLRLPAIRAIGCNGFPIVAGPAFPCSHVEPLDTQPLPVGRFRVYACLGHEKVPTGDLIEQTGNAGRPTKGQSRQHRAPRVLLAAGDERLKHRDWLPIAELERERRAGGIRTELNTSFHPPILSMAGYCHPNPISMLANRVLSEMKREAPNDSHTRLRSELMILQNVAESAAPEVVFMQTQRCLGMLRAEDDPPFILDSGLETYRYSPDTFCDFLARVHESLLGVDNYEALPAMLEIDGIRHLKLNGEFIEKDDFWWWSAKKGPFFASGIALYFPRAIRGTLPNIQYGRRKEDRHGFAVARAAKSVSGPGAVIVFEELKNEIHEIFLAADAETMHQRLRKSLGEGHAVYYY